MNRFQLIYNGELGLKNQNCLYIEELKNKYDLIHCENFNDFKNKYYKKIIVILAFVKDTYEYNYRPLMKLATCSSN